MIDAGDGADVEEFVDALTCLHKCCTDWKCMIAHPAIIKIDDSIQDGLSEIKNTQKRNRFGKEYLGYNVYIR